MGVAGTNVGIASLEAYKDLSQQVEGFRSGYGAFDDQIEGITSVFYGEHGVGRITESALKAVVESAHELVSAVGKRYSFQDERDKRDKALGSVTGIKVPCYGDCPVLPEKRRLLENQRQRLLEIQELAGNISTGVERADPYNLGDMVFHVSTFQYDQRAKERYAGLEDMLDAYKQRAQFASETIPELRSRYQEIMSDSDTKTLAKCARTVFADIAPMSFDPELGDTVELVLGKPPAPARWKVWTWTWGEPSCRGNGLEENAAELDRFYAAIVSELDVQTGIAQKCLKACKEKDSPLHANMAKRMYGDYTVKKDRLDAFLKANPDAKSVLAKLPPFRDRVATRDGIMEEAKKLRPSLGAEVPEEKSAVLCSDDKCETVTS